MTNQRILLVHEDQLLGHIYRDRLEYRGFTVEAARSGEDALRAIATRPPDLMVLDTVTPDPAPARLIATLRAQAATHALPIVVLPTARGQLAEAAQNAGATRVLKRTADPIAELLEAIETTLRLPPSAPRSQSLPFSPDPSWITMGLDSAPETISTLRRSLLALSRATDDPTCLRALFQRIHALAEQMALLGQKPLFTFASAIEALAFDLLRLPAQINASTIRTLGQSLDLLAHLVQEPQRSRLQDPAYAPILVVDDEDSVAQLIQAAMRLVNLEATTAATPTAGLATLAARPFAMVFLDIALPEMNGFDLCTRARALPLHQKTPIVFITGMDTLANRVQSNLSGGQDFVGKPFNVVELGLKALLWVYKSQLALA